MKDRPGNGRCYCCGELGHWVAECPHKTSPRGAEWRERMAAAGKDQCGSCGELGHWAADCPTPRPERPGRR